MIFYTSMLNYNIPRIMLDKGTKTGHNVLNVSHGRGYG